jgi:hypothetical protein
VPSRHRAEVDVELYSNSVPALHGVRGQRHAPAALPLRSHWRRPVNITSLYKYNFVIIHCEITNISSIRIRSMSRSNLVYRLRSRRGILFTVRCQTLNDIRTSNKSVELLTKVRYFPKITAGNTFCEFQLLTLGSLCPSFWNHHSYTQLYEAPFIISWFQNLEQYIFMVLVAELVERCSAIILTTRNLRNKGLLYGVGNLRGMWGAE